MLRSRLTYLAVVLGALTFYFCFNGYISTYVMIMVLILPFFSLLLSLPALFGIRAELSAPTSAARKGTALPVRITLKNRSPFLSGKGSVLLTFQNTLTGEEEKEQIFFMAGRQPLNLSHTLQSPTCGQVLCSLSRGRLSDYMGLFSLPLRISQKSSVLFYPTVYEPVLFTEQTAMPDSEGERYSQTASGNDPSELFDLREYREGDKISRIHWKLSQKSEEMLVKDFGLPLSDQLLFLLEPNGSGVEADAMLDVFCTLSAFLAQHGVPHRAIFRDRSGSPVLREILELEESRSILEELLLAGRSTLSLFSKELPLPAGVSHVVYLCCKADSGALTLLRKEMPSARISVLFAGQVPDALPENCQWIDISPGTLPDALNGFRL